MKPLRRKRTTLDGSSVMRILVVKPSSLGDILHTFPALSLLRKQCPNALLDFVINPEFKGVLDESPFPVSRRIEFQRRKLGKPGKMLPEMLKLGAMLRKYRYDLAIDFQGLLRSGICVRLSRADSIAGFADPREKTAVLCYNMHVKGGNAHAIERNLALVTGIFGLETALPERMKQPMARPCPLVELSGRNYVVVMPGARWTSKEFPPKLFAEVISGVHAGRPDIVFVLSGTKSDRNAANQIKNLLPPDLLLCDAVGRTDLAQLFALLSGSSACVTNDSGPLHIASYLGKPTFSFYGPTLPRLTGPWYPESKVYSAEEVDCLGCMKRECPRHEECHGIDAKKVAEDILNALSHRGDLTT